MILTIWLSIGLLILVLSHKNTLVIHREFHDVACRKNPDVDPERLFMWIGIGISLAMFIFVVLYPIFVVLSLFGKREP